MRKAGAGAAGAGSAEAWLDDPRAARRAWARGEAVRHLVGFVVGYGFAVAAWPGGPPEPGLALVGLLLFLSVKGALVLALRGGRLGELSVPGNPLSLLPIQSAAAQLCAAMVLAATLAALRLEGLAPGMALLDGMVSLGVVAALSAAAHLAARRRQAVRLPRLLLVGRPDALLAALSGLAPGSGRVAALFVEGAVPGLEPGGALGGVPVVDAGALERLLVARAVDRVVLLRPLLPSIAAWTSRRCLEAGVVCARSGALGASLASLRESLAQAPEELLSRPPIEGRPERDRALLEALSGRVVLVTGAGSALGAELCRQLVRLGPRRLVLCDRAEASLALLERELAPRTTFGVSSHLLDVRDEDAVFRLCARARPGIVFHLDLHRRTAPGEADPSTAVLCNAGGTRALVAAARAAGTERLVLAGGAASVHPTSVVGASLRLAELLVRAAPPARGGGRLRAAAVRLPSLLGVEGSVVPLWIDELGRGLPLSVTDDDAERRFLTLPEAARALLEAAVAGEPGAALIPDAGPPRKVVDLAYRVLAQAGLGGEGEVPLCRIGLRAGEPMQQQLTWPDEAVRVDAACLAVGDGRDGRSDGEVDATPMSLWTAQGALPDARTLEASLAPLLEAARAGHDARVVRSLMALVPGYRASGAQERLTAEDGGLVEDFELVIDAEAEAELEPRAEGPGGAPVVGVGGGS